MTVINELTLVVSTNFSPTPGPRKILEGKFSGEEFRESCLEPKLKEAIEKNTKLLIDLDGTAGFGTSFLEEAFGGLIRSSELSPSDALKILDIQFTRPAYRRYKDLIIKYIKDART